MNSWRDPFAENFIHMTCTSDFHPVHNKITNSDKLLHIQQYFIQCNNNGKIS